MVIGNSQGVGVSKTKTFKGKYEAKLEFLKGLGVQTKRRKPSVGEVWIFLESQILCFHLSHPPLMVFKLDLLGLGQTDSKSPNIVASGFRVPCCHISQVSISEKTLALPKFYLPFKKLKHRKNILHVGVLLQ